MAMQGFVCSLAFDDDESQQILKGNMVMCSVHASVLHGCLKGLAPWCMMDRPSTCMQTMA